VVKHRHVFFLPGFDPRRPSHYHALYATHAVRQSRVNGMRIETGKAQWCDQDHALAWTVESQDGELRVKTTMELLRWDDLVRRHWARSVGKALLQGVHCAAHYVRSGALIRLLSISVAPVLVAASPLIAGALALILVLACAATAAFAASSLGAPAWMCALAALGTSAMLLGLTLRPLSRLSLMWFARLGHFMLRHARGDVPQLDERLRRFGDRIRERVEDSEIDEVLVIGHSVGSILAVSALAHALRHSDVDDDARARIGLLTLGNCLPIVSALPCARAFSDDVAKVTKSDVWWVDVTSPADWAAFATSGARQGQQDRAASSAQQAPHSVSPRFHTLFESESYRGLKRRRWAIHLQYLLSTDVAGAYDYYSITAGSVPLRQRFMKP